MPNTHNISTILFDLGRVLVELDGPPIKNHWLAEPIAELESWQRWGRSTVVKAFESGELGADAFSEALVKEQGLVIAAPQFAAEFSAWPKALFPGVVPLLTALGLGYRLAYFSNTSCLHVPRLNHEMGLAELIPHRFASCEIGFFKPDPAGFEFILSELDVAPASVLFLDDSPANIEAARSCGLLAEQVVGLAEVKAALAKHGICH